MCGRPASSVFAVRWRSIVKLESHLAFLNLKVAPFLTTFLKYTYFATVRNGTAKASIAM